MTRSYSPITITEATIPPQLDMKEKLTHDMVPLSPSLFESFPRIVILLSLLVAGKTKQEYIHIMTNLGLPLPEKIMEALQTNITATVDSAIHFPTISQLNQIHQLGPDLVHHLVFPAISGRSDKDRRMELVRLFGSMLSDDETTSLLAANPVLLDVRLENECAEKELGIIPGSINIPLSQLPKVTTPVAQSKCF